jgi:hypothetical protein
MKNLTLKGVGESIFKGYLFFCLTWVIFALGVQVFFVYLEASNQEERMRNLVNQFEWKFDGTFKNNPENIFYEGPKTK